MPRLLIIRADNPHVPWRVAERLVDVERQVLAEIAALDVLDGKELPVVRGGEDEIDQQCRGHSADSLAGDAAVIGVSSRGWRAVNWGRH